MKPWAKTTVVGKPLPRVDAGERVSGPPLRLLDPHCRYAGEEVAAVAADTPAPAREALRAIVVEYEERPFVLDAAGALEPGAPAVHRGRPAPAGRGRRVRAGKGSRRRARGFASAPPSCPARGAT
jgi:CO/xanthine dehydrogenase Mo-binding subunit